MCSKISFLDQKIETFINIYTRVPGKTMASQISMLQNHVIIFIIIIVLPMMKFGSGEKLIFYILIFSFRDPTTIVSN